MGDIKETLHYFTDDVSIVEVTHKFGSALYLITKGANKFSVLTFKSIVKLYIHYRSIDFMSIDRFIKRVKKAISSTIGEDTSQLLHTYIMFLQDMFNPKYISVHEYLSIMFCTDVLTPYST